MGCVTSRGSVAPARIVFFGGRAMQPDMHAVYDASYDMTAGLIGMVMQLGYFVWPFLLLLMVIMVFNLASGWSFRGSSSEDDE